MVYPSYYKFIDYHCPPPGKRLLVAECNAGGKRHCTRLARLLKGFLVVAGDYKPLASSRTGVEELCSSTSVSVAMSVDPEHWRCLDFDEQAGRAGNAASSIGLPTTGQAASDVDAAQYPASPGSQGVGEKDSEKDSKRMQERCRFVFSSGTQEQWAISLGCYIANLEVALARCAHPLLLAYAAAGNLLLQVLLLPHLARFFCW